MDKIKIRPHFSLKGVLGIIFFIVVLALFWTGTNNLGDRVITLRYFLFVLTGLTAFLTPYLLFPDVNVPVLQLGNVSGSTVRSYVLTKVKQFTWPVFLLIGLILFGDLRNPFDSIPEKFIYMVSSISFFGGILLISVVRYLKSGEASQFWKESEKGKKLRQNLADYFKYPLDPGSLPSLLNTVLVFFTGSVSLVIGAILQQQLSLYAELVLFLLILGTGIILIISNTKSFVRSLYATDAFFREFFGVSLKAEEMVNKREAEQLWWVPAQLKMHVWQFLLQLDRKIPAGRAVAAGHFAVWFIAYQRPDPHFLVIIWILFAVLHQLFTLMTIQQDMAPHWFLRWVDRTLIWTLSRFWMQLRWILPLLLSMNIQYFIFGVPGFSEQGIVVLIFLISSLLASLFGTMKLKQDLKT